MKFKRVRKEVKTVEIPQFEDSFFGLGVDRQGKWHIKTYDTTSDFAGKSELFILDETTKIYPYCKQAHDRLIKKAKEWAKNA